MSKKETLICVGGGGGVQRTTTFLSAMCCPSTVHWTLFVWLFYSVVSSKSALLCPEMLPRQAAHWVLNRADVCLILNLERAVSICLRGEFFPGQGG